MGWLREICRTGIFIICAQALVYFRPDKTYEKYMKLLVSVMILVQLLCPISDFVTGKGDESLEGRIARFQESFQDSMGQAAASYEERERQMEQIALRELLMAMDAMSHDGQDLQAGQSFGEGEREAGGSGIPSARNGGAAGGAGNMGVGSAGGAGSAGVGSAGGAGSAGVGSARGASSAGAEGSWDTGRTEAAEGTEGGRASRITTGYAVKIQIPPIHIGGEKQEGSIDAGK